MAKIEELLAAMRANPADVRFEDATKVVSHYFGEYRQNDGSHRLWKMPWAGDPRVNVQADKNGKAKPYQVRQALQAIEFLEERPSSASEHVQAEAKPDAKAAKRQAKKAAKSKKK